jgi:hypothetical protein
LTAAGYDPASPDAGTYALSESGPSGYTQTSLTCTNAVGQVTSVTLGLGESVTCTFVNDDNAASLTLVKTVINDNGGTALASAWTLTAAGYDPASPDAGTYALSESGPSGYTQTSLTCTNATGQVTSVTLALGESVTCTFVNDDNKASPAGTTEMSWVLHDSISITGLRAGADQAGSVTFRVYSDAACSMQVGSDETVGGVDADDSYGTATGVTVTAPGTYYWQVTYSGDQYNNGFTTRCGYEVTTIGETVTGPAIERAV